MYNHSLQSMPTHLIDYAQFTYIHYDKSRIIRKIYIKSKYIKNEYFDGQIMNDYVRNRPLKGNKNKFVYIHRIIRKT